MWGEACSGACGDGACEVAWRLHNGDGACDGDGARNGDSAYNSDSRDGDVRVALGPRLGGGVQAALAEWM